LEQSVGELRFEHAALADAVRTLARVHRINVALEPDMKGEVTLELHGGTVAQALETMLTPLGYHYELRDGGVAVRRLKTILYPIDYPQLTRSGTGSTSVSLSGNNNQGFYPPSVTGQVPPPATGANQVGNDAMQISISQENQSNFWANLETELHAMLKDGDSLVLNRFSGIAQVTTTAARHETIAQFLSLVNHRITQQVDIKAELVEVSLTDERKLGVDWDLAESSLGGGVKMTASSPVEVTGLGGAVLAGNTFVANLGFKQATAVINALREQGEVRTVAQPRLTTLNNQMAFVKVAEDRPFFRLQQSTTFQQAGVLNPVNQTQENYSVSTITIGTILAVTPQVDAKGVITLDVAPAITRLQSIITSPDGKQTAPVVEVKQASTIVRVREGETAVIGGLIADEDGESTRAVPGLGAVPLVGAAFRSKAKVHTRSELVIFLTPTLKR
jgi:type II secretory pathway component GspD/PulD (secretin)